MESNDCPVLILASGQTIKVRRVKLFDERLVNEVAVLRAKAAKGLGGVSTGIGFWGSPGWVLGGAAAMGFIEGMLSQSARTKALEDLKLAEGKRLEMLARSKYFNAGEIMNGDDPHPAVWRASGNTKIRVDNLGWMQKNAVFAQHGKSKADIIWFHRCSGPVRSRRR
jgi:hypothetical protein